MKARGVKEVMISEKVSGDAVFQAVGVMKAKVGCFFGERDILQFHHSRRKNQ